MKNYIKILLLVLFPILVKAQTGIPDSLRQALKMATTDSAKNYILFDLGIYYDEGNLDSSINYIDQDLLVSRKNNRKINEAKSLSLKGYVFMKLGNYAESFEAFQDAFKILEDPTNENKAWKYDNNYPFSQYRLDALGWTYESFGKLLGATDGQEKQIIQLKEALQLGDEVEDSILEGDADMNLGRAYMSLNNLDSASIFFKKTEQIFERTVDKKYLPDAYLELGRISSSKGNKNKQLYYYHKGLEALTGQNNPSALSFLYFYLSDYYLQEKQKDSSLYYANKSLEVLKSIGSKDIGENYLQIAKSYQLRNETDSAYKYQGFALTAIDSTNQANIKNLAEFQKRSFKDQMRLKELEQEKASYQSKIRTNILLGGLFILLIIAIFLFKNNRQKQKANSLIAKQKEKVESTLSELKSTQSQLIQSEKMASLGELTAGIAHEIQNPLNFVNNFSEVNKEMLEELKAERLKPKEERDEKTEDEIINDVIDNSEKINHHGKRAGDIVKGMLQHSRSSTGVKEPTDINALADEYLRLSYHGLRAKDKSFNATMNTDFDESIGKINIIPQDIGRVLLNLYNNAFYVVKERQEAEGKEYEPSVTVKTSLNPSASGGAGKAVIITVSDNGGGIPESIKEKIFQPFFTTKPTGQGTGLGLSLSYDIVKAHGGEIKVESKEGEGTTFIIELASK